MRFSEIFIRKPVMTALFTAAVTLFGIGAYKLLPISDLPTVDFPVITINVSYPGADPQLMALAVATPLENECMQIPGLQSIISTNTEGSTQIALTFDLSRNVDLAAPDVQAAIMRAQANLPKNLPQPPTYKKSNPSDKPIFYVLLKSDVMTPAQIYDIANKRLGQRISMVNGVAEVDIWGARRAVHVQADPQRATAYGIALQDIQNAVVAGTVTTPGGSVNGKESAWAIQPNSQLLTADDYNNLIVKFRDGAYVRVKDIGQAVESLQTDTVLTNYHIVGDDKIYSGAVIVSALRSPGSNTVRVANDIRELLEEVRPNLPGVVSMDVVYDRSMTIKDSINDVKFTLILAFALVVMVIFIFLGRISDTIIPGMALPLSMLSTFVVMYAAGFSLDNLSMMALTLSVGFLVDDAIVVLENTVRLVEEGRSPFAAAIESAREISGTVISMTLALVTVFVPLVFMGGIVGRTFREFALTVIIAVLCSGIVSLTLTPMMCARMVKPSGGKRNILQRGSDLAEKIMIGGYSAALRLFLRHRVLSLLSWALCLGGTFWFFKVLPQSFMPVGDSGVIQGAILAPLGTSTDRMRLFQAEINKILAESPYVHHFATTTGSTTGADQTTGKIVISLKPKEERPPIDIVTQRLRETLNSSAFPLGFVYLDPMPVIKVSTGGESTASGAKYSFVLSGQNLKEVNRASLELERRMRDIPIITGVQNSVKPGMPQFSLDLRRDRASTFGITAADINSSLGLAFAQNKTTQFINNIDQYYVIVELLKKYQRNETDITKVYVPSVQSGKLAPMETVAEWKDSSGPETVQHIQQMNAATLSFNLLPGEPIGKAALEIERAAAETVPAGITQRFMGEALLFKQAMAAMPLLVALAVFLMYVILGALYESYIHPFTVLTTLPVAACGGLASLWLFHSEVSLYAYVGMFMLLGIVAKNGIMMIDFANKLMEEGQSAFDAIYHACRIRFRPILMTGAAAIMGALPLALGLGADGESRRPLGLVIAGGLIFAQVITLFVTPGIFLYMQWAQEKILDRFELSRSDAARKALERKAAPEKA